MGYIDLHCDTITELGENETLSENGKSITLQGLKQGDVLVQCCSIFIDTGGFPIEERSRGIDQEVKRILHNYTRTMVDYEHDLLPIHTFSDILECDKSGLTGILLTIEDGGVLKGSMDRLHDLYQKGVRLITLTWNHENEIGYPNSTDPQKQMLGLKDHGMELMEEMQKLGIIVDVSHLSDGGFYDVARDHKRKGIPFVASHSNVRAIANHPRNMTDDMIHILADAGGVMGLNFYPPFLNEKETGKGCSRIEDMIRHMTHIRNVGGAECMALGSDFDGISGTLEIPGPQSMWKLWSSLKKNGFTEHELDLIMFENAARVMKCILK